MAEFIESGAIVDVMLALVALELGLLVLHFRRTGRGVAPLALVLNASAGVSLMLALRAALTDAGWAWIAAPLVGALVFHAADLGQRWSRAGR